MTYPALAADVLRAANLLRNRPSASGAAAAAAAAAASSSSSTGADGSSAPRPASNRAPLPPPPIVLGHSMGGKAAMAAALVSPNEVSGLIVVDIAPVDYGSLRLVGSVADAMSKVPLDTARSREEADAVLRASISDDTLRRFVMTNYVPARSPTSPASWRVNLDVIRSHLPLLASFPQPPMKADGSSVRPYDGPALFLYGSQSNYVTPDNHAIIKTLFPQAQLQSLPAGHWVHAEDPDAFVLAVSEFLKDLP